ncbi:MAG: peptidylprolyl isomerase [Acidimicrobiales bacterium]
MPSEKRIRQQANQRRMQALRAEQVRKQRRQRFWLFGGAATVVVALIAVLSVVLSGGGGKAATSTTLAPTTAGSTTSTSTGPTTTVPPPVSVPLLDAPAKPGCPKLDGSSPHYTHFAAAPPMCINTAKQYTATMLTDLGPITIKLLAATDPTTVNNFVFLAGYHFYNGTAFHRVITGFVDQGGDPKGTGEGGPGYSFNGGAPKSASVYTAGALAMANSGTSSSDGSQFFFVVGKGGAELQPLYSYFGQVTSGMAVVNKINADGSASGTPTVVHKILKVTINVS